MYNAVSENHGKFLTIIATNNDLVYYIYDGEDLIQCFDPKEIIEYIPPEKKMNLQNNT